MALAWDDLDEGWDDEAEWWQALAAEPPCGSWPGILERVVDLRPAWHAMAACRDHPELDWFAGADQDATQAICGACPAAGPCADFGRREGFGVWGGLAHQMVGGGPRDAQPRPVGRPAAACVECGENRRIVGRGLCQACYSRAVRRRAGAQPQQVGRKVAACGDCCGTTQIYARGLCQSCYWRARRQARAG